jgi:hypothetical protein
VRKPALWKMWKSVRPPRRTALHLWHAASVIEHSGASTSRSCSEEVAHAFVVTTRRYRSHPAVFSARTDAEWSRKASTSGVGNPPW